MTHTRNLRAFDAELDRFRKAMIDVDDDLLALKDRHDRLSALDREGQEATDAELKARYGMEN